jgi:hypothetical protein
MKIGSVIFWTAITCGMACWLYALFNGIQAVKFRKPGVPLFPNWRNGPFDVLYHPENLTERGLVARKRFYFAFVAFFIFIVVGLAGKLLL